MLTKFKSKLNELTQEMETLIEVRITILLIYLGKSVGAYNWKINQYQRGKKLFRELQEGNDLKGHCHEDFAVLGQFCAKIITLKL